MSELEQIAQEVLAEKATAKNTTAEDYTNTLRETLKGNSKAANETSELEDLVNLIVITHQERTLLRSDMWQFISQFIVAPNAMQGNGRRFIKHFPQKGRNFDAVKNQFTASDFSKTKFKVQFIKFKNDDGTVAQTSDRLVFDAVYSVAEMITYFINGQLLEFIEDEIIGKIGQSIEITLYDIIMTELVKPGGKQMTGTAPDLFAALTEEVFVEAMKIRQNDYRYNNNPALINAIDASRKDDLILICGPKLMVNLKSNIMSQLFNSANVDIKEYVGQIHVSNNKFIDDGDGGWTTADTAYVDENTIIIIDKKNYFKAMKMLDFSGSQDYPLNMSKLRVVHLWFAKGKLEWGKALFYTNPNLNVMPGTKETEA